MTTDEFFKLSPIEMEIEVLETEAYNLSCKANTIFTKRGHCSEHKMFLDMSEKKLQKVDRLKKINN